jgi:hypothetical protein
MTALSKKTTRQLGAAWQWRFAAFATDLRYSLSEEVKR